MRENLEDTARRELEEETGVKRSSDWNSLQYMEIMTEIRGPV